MRKMIFVLTVLCNILVFAQEPFNIPMYDSGKIKILKTADFTSEFGFTKNTNRFVEVSNDSLPNFSILSGALLSADFAGEIAIPRINLDVLVYRLGIYTFKDKSRLYLPLVFLTRNTNDYDTTNLASAVDLTGFAGAPITCRLMPSWQFDVGLENYLNIGFILDYRGMFYRDSLNYNVLNFGHSWYGAVGFRYSGPGEAMRNMDGKYYGGVWSFSFLYSFSGSEKGVFDKIFLSEKSKSSNLEAILKFRVFDIGARAFNFDISALYHLERPSFANNNWIFKLSFGFN